MLDALLKFSSAQAPTTGDTASTDYIDALQPGNALVKPLYLEIIVNTTVTSGGAGTVAFVLQTDDNSSFSSPTEIYSTAAIAKTTLVAGYKAVQIPLPVGMERYIRVVYRVATADLTAGKFDAYLTDRVRTAVV